jgi:hypothetical protein
MRARFSLKALLAALTIFAVLCAGIGLAKRLVGREERVFSSVKVGDTEQHLVRLLESNYIDYGTDDAGNFTLYSHSDGFIGICFYYVDDGRVVSTARD